MQSTQIIVIVGIFAVAIAALAAKDSLRMFLHKNETIMTRMFLSHILTNIVVAIITLLAWYSGFIVMEIVYDSVIASILFGIVIAVIIFCESRFSYITLKSDGKVTINKEEVKSNLWQIIAATLIAVVVSIPLVLKLFEQKILLQANNAAHDLGLQLKTLVHLFPSHWAAIILVCFAVVVLYNVPTILKMASEE